MAMDPNDAVNIPKGPSGPKTEAGKAKSSRNAIRTGLYAARDFMREGEEEEYAQTLIKLMDELTPEGTLEEVFATEIMGATWRLRRCRLVEEAFGMVDDLDFDPMMDERTEKSQKSVDRARGQSHLILRRSIAELAKLQKARFLCEQSQNNSQPAPGPAPASTSTPAGFDALMALADKQLAQRYRESGLSSFCNAPVGQVSDLPSSPKHDSDLIRTDTQSQTSNQWSTGSFCNPAVGQVSDLPSSNSASGSFCKTTPETPAAPKLIPRNAPCPCGSGQKYKRCCARREANASGLSVLKPGWEQQPVVNAPPVLNKAA